MSGLDNLSQGRAIAELQAQVRSLMLATPNNSSSIGSGGLRVHSGGVINIENGGLVVNGSATIIGTLNADGTINMSGLFIASGEMRLNGSTVATGDFTISGPLLVDGNTTFNGELNINGITNITGDTTVTGKLYVKGPLDVTGTLDIKGESTLQNDLTVQGGGKIKVGSNMTITPAAGGGSVEFANGASVASSGTDLKMNAVGAALSLGTQAVMTGGTSTMVMAGSSTSLNTPLVIISARMQARGIRQAPAGAEANLRWDPATGEIMYIA